MNAYRPITPLLKESDFCELLGGISERTFQQMRADGIVCEPLELGPRIARWTHDDYLETLNRIPRRKKAPEPTHLAKGKEKRLAAKKEPAQ